MEESSKPDLAATSNNGAARPRLRRNQYYTPEGSMLTPHLKGGGG